MMACAEDSSIIKPTNGVWLLSDDGSLVVEDSSAAQTIIFVPTEHVLIIALHLPVASRRTRLAALPFAIEDHVAAPLDSVHIALGAKVAFGTHLAGVIAHDTIERWIVQLTLAGLGHASIVPDALRLPVPLPGLWSVDFQLNRVVVRTDTAAGFATAANCFPAMWEAAGSPSCLVYGSSSPTCLPPENYTMMPPVTNAHACLDLDLRQGRCAAPPRELPKALRRLTIISSIAVLTHLAVGGVGTVALHRIFAERAEIDLETVRVTLPDMPRDAGFNRLALRNLAANSRFLDLLATATASLAPVEGVTMTKIGFARRGLTIAVETADPIALQNIRTALANSRGTVISTIMSANSGRESAIIGFRASSL